MKNEIDRMKKMSGILSEVKTKVVSGNLSKGKSYALIADSNGRTAFYLVPDGSTVSQLEKDDEFVSAIEKGGHDVRDIGFVVKVTSS